MSAKPGERGYALAALLAGITIMMIALAAALPSWRYVMKREREEELIFRGGQIANAIVCYQRKTGTAPTLIDQLVKQKCLRQAFKDPMTADGKWRLLRPGEPPPPPPKPGTGPTPTPSPSSTARQGLGGPQISTGPFNGVSSLSTEKSLCQFLGQGDHYNKWQFIAQPNPQTRSWNRSRLCGKLPGPLRPPPPPSPTTK